MSTETTEQETYSPTFWRKKPIPVEAWQFTEANGGSVATWCGGEIVPDGVIIRTLEGDHLGRPGDWIIKGVRGEFYPCERSIFEETYEPVPAAKPDPEPPMPEGIYGRVEIAGYRDATGWVTEETRFGQQAAVVRDWNGCVTDVFILGPNSRMVALATPLKRPEPPRAIAAWSGDDDDDDSYDEDGDPYR